MVLAGLLVMGLPGSPVRADTTFNSGTTTVSTAQNFGDNLYVATTGTGTLTMSGGLVAVSGTVSQGAHGAIHLNSGGTLEIGVGGTTGVLGVSTLTNKGTLIFNRSNASTYTGVLSGSGAVTKLGGGTFTLSGSSSYTGATAVSGGKLLVNGHLGNTAVAVNASGLHGGGVLRPDRSDEQHRLRWIAPTHHER